MGQPERGEEESSANPQRSQRSKDSDIERIWAVSEGDLNPDREKYRTVEGAFGSAELTRGQWKNNIRLLVVVYAFISVVLLTGALMSPSDEAICLIAVMVAIVVLGLATFLFVREIGRMDP